MFCQSMMECDDVSDSKDKIMCKKLRELDGLNANAILSSCEVTSYPVDIKAILKKLGIKYGAMDFTDIEEQIPNVIKNRGNILGAVTIVDDDVNIFYSKGSTENRMRFTLAHELAHCCLNAPELRNKGHIEFRHDGRTSSPNEVAANIFAGQILIPKNPLLRLYTELIAPISDVMAQEFQVSTAVMEARLKYLNLDYYSLNAANAQGD